MLDRITRRYGFVVFGAGVQILQKYLCTIEFKYQIEPYGAYLS